MENFNAAQDFDDKPENGSSGSRGGFEGGSLRAESGSQGVQGWMQKRIQGMTLRYPGVSLSHGGRIQGRIQE